MHARVSPHLREHYGALEDMSPRALECAEEFRINTLVARLGFDVALLRDGSEKIGGRRLGESGDWSEALCFMLAVLATGSEKEYLAGVRQAQPTWMAGMRAVRKRALGIVGPFTSAALGATRLNDDQLPSGYANVTVVLARLLSQSMVARPPVTPDELRAFRRSLEPGGRRPATGRFAELVFDTSLEMSSRTRSGGLRRARAATSGSTMRYPSRLLTDQYKRAFAQRTSVHGGIVLVDQSGSMDLDESALGALLQRAPDALVVGYSHRPGDGGATPNVWILADRGAVAKTCPSGNVGNGVDGAVLRWAIARRRVNEPIVWVTDGQVTDSHDHPDETLTIDCATLVVRHRIRLVREMDDAGRALSSGRTASATQWRDFGRIGRKLQQMKGF